LIAWVGSLTVVRAQDPPPEPLRLERNVPGEAKAIQVDADDITTWVEGNERIILFKGQVLVQLGVVQARFDQGIARIDLEGWKRTHITHLELYGEGSVQLINGTDKRSGAQATVDLFSRGELKLSSHKNQLSQRAAQDDPLYRRWSASRAAQGPAPAEKPTAPGHDPLQRTSFQAPPTPTPKPPSDPEPGGQSQPPPTTAQAPVNPGPSRLLPAPSDPDPPMPTPLRAAVPSPSQPSASAPPLSPPRQFSIVPRSLRGFDILRGIILPNGERAQVALGGVILTVRGLDKVDILDIEADRLVVWTHESTEPTPPGTSAPGGLSGRETEFYLAGNVEIREQNGKDMRFLRADEVYYDIGRHVAVAIGADLEFRQPGVPDPIHFRAGELEELSPSEFRALRAEVSSSRTPAEPGLKVVFAEATLKEQRVPRESIFGTTFTNLITGQTETEMQQLIRGDNVFLKVEDVPIFYLPYVQGDANDPLGPIRDVSVGYNRIFGATFSTTLNVFDLFGLVPRPGLKWDLDLNYLTSRGPALGTTFDYAGVDFFGLPSRYNGHLRAMGMIDQGTDNLGGGRGPNDNHPEERGSVQWYQFVRELPEGFSLRSSLGLFSDHNYYEQYQKYPFDTDVNQDTFVYLEQQRDNWAWTLLGEKRIRNWVTETDHLPAVQGYLIGQSFFDLLTYSANASTGYYQLHPSQAPAPPFVETDKATNTGRFDLFQELDLPVALGPVKVVPYGILDLTSYTQDLNGDSVGRVYGGGGVRASMPFTRLYSDVESLFLNLNGLNHKITVTGNYYYAQSNVPFTSLPQLDRLDDDATDQARRDIHYVEPIFNPAHGLALEFSPQFNLQRYAIRRLVDDRVDTLDSIEVFQADVRQRLQTKRGYPGQQHIIDWMTLDLSASVFPRADRDNFGNPFSFLEYDYLWNVGDRTALTSSGWVDPVNNGARVFTVGAYLNRPDRTNFYLGFRSIFPVNSQAVTAGVTYIFSPKYAVTASTLYDFGTQQAIANSLSLTRTGSDIQVSLVLSYNALQNTFGFNLEVLPNLLAANHRLMASGLGTGGLGQGLFGR
jgi:hypothetical protein